MRLALAVTGAVCIATGTWGCGATPPPRGSEPVRIVHAVVPPGMDITQEESALRALLQQARPGGGVNPSAIVVVTNFSAVGAPPTTTPPASPPDGAPPAPQPLTAEDQGKRFAAVVQQAGLDIPVYVVPGAVDAAADTLTNWRAAVKAAQDALQGQAGATSVIDLGSCYALPPRPTGTAQTGTAQTGTAQTGTAQTGTAQTGTAQTGTAQTGTAQRGTAQTATAATGCVAQLRDTNVRLVAYPGLYGTGVAGAAEAWATVFDSAMNTTDADATTILIAPLAAAVIAPPAAEPTWMRTAANAQIVLGIEGSPTLRRSAYEQDSRWKAPGLLGQWLVTPPLIATAANAAEASQGASVVSVSRGGLVWRDLLWYSAGVSRFDGNVRLDGADTRQRPFWATTVVGPVVWLWRLGRAINSDLAKAAIFFIAMLAAFLTSVAVWQIPPASAVGVTPTLSSTGTPTTVTIARTSLLEQNFARTVLSGLGGLAAATVLLETFDSNEGKAQSQQFYTVWFSVWFFVLLLGSSFVKSLAEGWRVITYVGDPSSNKISAQTRWKRTRWFLLTTIDSFFNLIQGRNELKSMLWVNEISAAQKDTIRAIGAICDSLSNAFTDYLKSPEHNFVDDEVFSPPCQGNVATHAPDVRVAVSVLANDKQSVYYVAWQKGSSSNSFPQTSVAFVSVAARIPLWWKRSYSSASPPILLFDNTLQSVAELPKLPLFLPQFYQPRKGNYGSFIVIPIPWRAHDDRRRAALHISFKNEGALHAIWPCTVDASPYSRANQLLDETPVDLQRLLRQSIDVIESLLQHFNEDVFNDLKAKGQI